MIISRTPFRISLVGGGTDMRTFYNQEEGAVLSTTIDKFIYVVVKRQTSIAETKYRINWSRIEFKDRIEDIEHPIVREAFKLMQIDFPVEITTFADIPANTGLGSSSAFTVGLLHALFALKGQMVTKATLADMAAKIEVDVLGRSMGKQDHYAAAYGNWNVFRFHSNDTVTVEPVFYKAKTRASLEENLMLFYTGLKRDASEVLKSQIQKTPDSLATLRKMRDLVNPMREILSAGNGHSVEKVGELLDVNWKLKRSITEEISSTQIDAYYDQALKAGAVGGKLLGAGGGGFILLVAPTKKHEEIRKALLPLDLIPFKFDTGGTRITYYDQSLS